MGLDIRVYNNLKVHATELDRESEEYADAGFIYFYVNPDFPRREEGLDENLAYTGEKVLSFRVGGYSDHVEWREELAHLAGYNNELEDGDKKINTSYSAAAWKTESGPFRELIVFSDCDGTIGPVVSAKLAKDFQDHQAKADAHPDERFCELYANWRQAFELASNNGMVRLA